MSYWEDLDDHLRQLEPNDLNLDYMGVSHLDYVSRVEMFAKQTFANAIRRTQNNESVTHDI